MVEKVSVLNRSRSLGLPLFSTALLLGCSSQLGDGNSSDDGAEMGGEFAGNNGDGTSAGGTTTGGADTGGTTTGGASSGGTDTGGTTSGGTSSGGTDTGGTSSSGTDTGGSSGTGGSPPAGASPFKGIAGASPCDDLSRVGATWFYTWGLRSNCDPGDDIEYVPMVWGAGNADNLDGLGTSGATHLLGFNEPERAEQANIDVAQAISLWPQLEATGLLLGSPATASSPDGEAWLDDFMTQADAQGRRVDFIAAHWYGWGSGGCDNINAHFTGFMERMMSYGIPVWITEWGCYNESGADAQAFYNDAVDWLIARPQVERYAWFLTRATELGDAWEAQNLVTDNDTLTALGQDYAASQAYR